MAMVIDDNLWWNSAGNNSNDSKVDAKLKSISCDGSYEWYSNDWHF